ncbi:hypothetical protein POM88_038735 [Heracleum sosnowskyi]|uniref:Amino acid transporter transmembrane domain-containing protein n=1 Tax=Heracleum sosnowskyi TaxID=360622 RepID=A0AAD8H9V8_9APIA|nr:hypothetical protein POM88_038735 [Heracleum sosnowskyi]
MVPYVSHGETEGSGLSGAVFNLATTVIGAGLMALITCNYESYGKSTTYGEVVQNALGKQAKIFSEICIILNNAGVLVVYLIILGDVMSGSLHHSGLFDQWRGHGFWDHRKLLILLVLIIFLAPLCALDRIDSLTITSAASVVLAVIFIVVAIIVALIRLLKGTLAAPRWTPDLSSTKAIMDLLVVIPIMRSLLLIAVTYCFEINIVAVTVSSGAPPAPTDIKLWKEMIDGSERGLNQSVVLKVFD